VRKNQLEGIVTKRAGSQHRSGECSLRLAQMAGESRSGVLGERLHPEWQHSRFAPGRVLRRELIYRGRRARRHSIGFRVLPSHLEALLDHAVHSRMCRIAPKGAGSRA
jgi:hypothetical protein